MGDGGVTGSIASGGGSTGQDWRWRGGRALHHVLSIWLVSLALWPQPLAEEYPLPVGLCPTNELFNVNLLLIPALTIFPLITHHELFA